MAENDDKRTDDNGAKKTLTLKGGPGLGNRPGVSRGPSRSTVVVEKRTRLVPKPNVPSGAPQRPQSSASNQGRPAAGRPGQQTRAPLSARPPAARVSRPARLWGCLQQRLKPGAMRWLSPAPARPRTRNVSPLKKRAGSRKTPVAARSVRKLPAPNRNARPPRLPPLPHRSRPASLRPHQAMLPRQRLRPRQHPSPMPNR